MERGSDKHASRIDDTMQQDVESVVGRSPVEARAEEFREQEGPAEGEPTPDARISGDRALAGTLGDDEVEGRAGLARHLPPSVFPARTEELVAAAVSARAPVRVIEQLRTLPDQSFETLAAVWEGLGGRTEYREHKHATDDAEETRHSHVEGHR